MWSCVALFGLLQTVCGRSSGRRQRGSDAALKLTQWKQEPEKAFLSEVSSVVLQQSLLNLDTAFTNFFEKRAKYPKFKSRRHRQTARYATNAFTFRGGRITLAKQSEPLDIVWSRPLPDDAKILNLTI